MKDISTPPHPRMMQPSNFSWGTTLRGPIFSPIWAPSPRQFPNSGTKNKQEKISKHFFDSYSHFKFPNSRSTSPRHLQKKALNAIGAPAPFSEPLLISHELLELYSTCLIKNKRILKKISLLKYFYLYSLRFKREKKGKIFFHF